MPPAFLRRLITIPGVMFTVAVLTIGFPVWFALAVLVDLLVGRGSWRTTRVLLFLIAFGVADLGAAAQAAGIWVRCGFGKRIWANETQAALQGVVASYAHTLLGLSEKLFGLKVEATGMEALADSAPLLSFCHHTSILDAVLPAELLGYRSGYQVHYVLKKALSWAPAFDVGGHLIKSHFVDRSSTNTERELAALAWLATNLTNGQSPVIYPEGTFYNPTRFAKALERLAAQAPELVERAKQLRYVLPPRPGGVSAMLDAAPGVDVLFFAHAGFEKFDSIPNIYRNLPFKEPVRVHIWRVSRSEVPVAPQERYGWVFAQFEQMDSWISTQLGRK